MLIDKYLKLEQSAKEMTEEIENDKGLQEQFEIIADKMDALREERRLLTEISDSQAKEIGEQQKDILEELKGQFDGENKLLEFDTGTVGYRITKTTVIHDPIAVAEGLRANGKLAEGIKSFDLKIIRSFLEAGLLEGAAGFEEKVNVKVSSL